MKYLLYLVGITYIIGLIAFFKFGMLNKIENQNSKNIKESIVVIIPEEKLISFKNNPRGAFEDNKNYGVGAGFIISTDGKIQTVNHVVENNDINYTVILNNKKYNTEIVSRDSTLDLAILKILTTDNEIFSPLEIENNSEKIIAGETITSYGVNIKNLTITSNTGILINKKSKLDSISNLLEISNSLNSGFSGGPIINKNGKVIGINYAISEGKNYGIGF